jgi:hypothetical protein
MIEEPYKDRAKIGKSTNINRRLKELQTGNPDIKFHHSVMKLINDDFESVLHERFAEKRIGGEWFKFTEEELINAIGDINIY